MNTVLIAKFGIATTLTLGLVSPATSLASSHAPLSAPTSTSGAAAGQITLR